MSSSRPNGPAAPPKAEASQYNAGMQMPTILAGLVLLSSAQAPVSKPPYEVGKEKVYLTTITIEEMGLDVHVTHRLQPSAKSENGFQALWRWTELEMQGQVQEEGWDVPITLGKRGELIASESEFGADGRRMNTPFFLVYAPEDLGDKKEWTYAFKPEKPSDGPAYTAKYQIAGTEAVSGEETTKVTVELKEEGQGAMVVKGTYWVGKDGWVRKFDLSVENWPVPQMAQSVLVKIRGTLKP